MSQDTRASSSELGIQQMPDAHTMHGWIDKWMDELKDGKKVGGSNRRIDKPQKKKKLEGSVFVATSIKINLITYS